MKRKLIVFTLVLAMVVASFTCTAYAVGSFSDIKDDKTAAAAEVLKLMGVIDGTGNGEFNPDGELSRAEFCKMAVTALFSDTDYSIYSSMTIFPDVKASFWYAKYVNFASKKSLINGYPDGGFHPDDKIPVSQAVTILLRLIGYSDETLGGVWPYAQMDFAKEMGMFLGISSEYKANDTISRADAARLFVNTILLDARNQGVAFTLSDEVILKSVDIGSRKIKTSGGEWKTNKSVSGSYLTGRLGYVVFSGGYAVSFIPNSLAATESEDAVIISSNGNKTPIDALAGRTDYKIYKNGALVTADKLKVDDVVTYRSDDNVAIVCDTRLTVYVESVYPSPANPTKIICLGGQSFDVLACAQSGSIVPKAGSYLSMLLTADGKVAGFARGNFASESLNNALFIVSGSKDASLICGNEVINLNGLKVSNPLTPNKMAMLGTASAESQSFILVSGNDFGTLNIEKGMLGTTKIADNALIFLNGEKTALKDLTSLRVDYARKNQNSEIDLLVVIDPFVPASNTVGRGYAETDPETGITSLTVVSQKGENAGTVSGSFAGDLGFVLTNFDGKEFTNIRPLIYKGIVNKESFINNRIVVFNTQSLEVAADVVCYNSDMKTWTDIDEAISYGRSFTLYTYDNVVYAIDYLY